jgi:hypothetical protein
MALLLFKKLVFVNTSSSTVSSTTSATEAIAVALRRDSDASAATVTNLEAQPLLPRGEGEKKTFSGWQFQFNARVISDATIGLSDGLTVPFALTAGLSTLGSTRTVWLAGLAELVAGAISMGLGGWLGAKSELYVLLSNRLNFSTNGN